MFMFSVKLTLNAIINHTCSQYIIVFKYTFYHSLAKFLALLACMFMRDISLYFPSSECCFVWGIKQWSSQNELASIPSPFIFGRVRTFESFHLWNFCRYYQWNHQRVGLSATFIQCWDLHFPKTLRLSVI